MSKDTIFYTNLKKLLKNRKMSMNQLEYYLGYPRNALNNYKKGGNPSVERVYKIARYFGVSVEQLIKEDESIVSQSVESIFKSLDSLQKLEMGQLCCEWLIKEYKRKNKTHKKLE